MAATTVTITRETASSPFGIAYKVSAADDEKCVLTKINETSPFRSTSIQPGYELISVNGTTLKGMEASEIKTLLASIGTIDVVVEARPVTTPCKFVFPLAGVARGVTYHKPPLPSLLMTKNVSDQKWERCFHAFSNEVLPELKIFLRMNTIFKNEMADYTGKQMSKGYVGFGMESGHEKKVFMMLNQTSSTHSNVVLVASNALARSNALLNSHGIMAELIFEEMIFPQFSKKYNERNHMKLPVGLRFTSIDDE